MSTTMERCYSELRFLHTFEQRFEYLKLHGGVGRSTFGFDRYLNQRFYGSVEWQDAKREVILRDNGCDLGIEGFEIFHRPLVHHMNPMTIDDLVGCETWIIDPEYLVLTSHKTHNDIHFGVKKSLPKVVTERRQGDTNLW